MEDINRIKVVLVEKKNKKMVSRAIRKRPINGIEVVF